MAQGWKNIRYVNISTRRQLFSKYDVILQTSTLLSTIALSTPVTMVTSELIYVLIHIFKTSV